MSRSAALMTALLLAGCPRPGEPISIAPLPSDDPWYPLRGSELTPRSERPIYSSGGRGLVWEQPEATCAARVASDRQGRTTLVWAERPGGQERWRIQTRRWFGEGWLILAPPIFPDPIPDIASTRHCPQLTLSTDTEGRPLLAYVGSPTDGGAARSVWRLEAPLWRPLGLPGLAEALDGLVALPGEDQIFLAVASRGETEVLRWDGLDWVPTAPLPRPGRWQITGDGRGQLWALGPAGAPLQVLLWSDGSWAEAAPLPDLGPVEAALLATDPEGAPVVLRSVAGTLHRSRGAPDGSWDDRILPGVRLGGSLLSVGFDGADGVVVAEGLALPGRDLHLGVDRVRLHYWAGEELLASRVVETRAPPGDRPDLFRTQTGAPALAWAGDPEILDSVFTRAWDGEDWGPMEPLLEAGGGVSDSKTDSDRPLLSRDPQGGLLVLWVERDPERGESLWLRRWEGSAWSPPEALSPWLIEGDCPEGPPATIRAAAVRYDRRGEPLVNLRARPACGQEASWQLSRAREGWTASPAPYPPEDPEILIDDLDLDGEHYLRVRRPSTDESYPPLMVRPVFGEHAAAAGPDGAPIVSWVGGTTGSLEIYAVRWDGEAWAELSGSATAGGISNSEAPSRHPAVLASEDGVCVAWSESGPGPRQIVLRCHRPPDSRPRP